MKVGVHSLLAAVLLMLVVAVPVLAVDSDGDGLRDGFEIHRSLTDPNARDSDGDGVIDSAEDLDGDRLSNLGEQRFKTNPLKRDSNGNGRSDGKEDSNHNGISNALEQDRRPLPSGLHPSLKRARKDAPAARRQCMADIGEAKLIRCTFGDTASDTTIVLFGDSHALMWLDAFAKAATDEGWKLITMFKGGCPSVTVANIGQYQFDRMRTCRRWRTRALSWINAHPPDLVVMSNTDGYNIVVGGRLIKPSKRPAVWKRGTAKTLAALPDPSHALILGDAPENNGDPVRCLKSHRRNMAKCEARRQAPRKRPFEVVERKAAAAAGAHFRTLYGKICSYDPCPVVQGNVLMWRDAGHLSTTFAKLLAPSLAAVVGDVLAITSPSCLTSFNSSVETAVFDTLGLEVPCAVN